MNEKQKNEQVAKISIFITSIFVIFMSVTYAFMNQTLTGTKRQVISAGSLQLELKEKDAITLENALPMYDEVGMIQKSFDFTLHSKATQNTDYTLKLKDVTSSSDKLDIRIVKYGLEKNGVLTKDLLSNLENNVIDSGTLAGNGTISYSLRLWIDSSVEDETLIKGKTLSYRIEVESIQEPPKNPNTAEVKLFASENLGENCKTYDDGVDTFLVGQCNQNYVWYSGKLWRVVLKNNETGAVKMITDNAMTTMSYNESGNGNFENSYADQWLTQEFLPTLHDYENYLVVDSVWDATAETLYAPKRPAGTTMVTRTVGLLGAYEAYTTSNMSDGLGTYLGNGAYWWTMTPYDSSQIFCVSTGGTISTSGLSGSIGDLTGVRISSYGVRPAVNLQAKVQIDSGIGTLTNPYRLSGDAQEITNGTTLLSTRYSGEYVHFNNTMYRIVGVENGLTKITALDKPAELKNNTFASDDPSDPAGDGLIADLESYYQTIQEPYKTMIATSTTWYSGMIGENTNYKDVICKSSDVNTNIASCEKSDTKKTLNVGLPRIGEMFTSQITRGTKDIFWLIHGDLIQAGYLINDGSLGYSLNGAEKYGARPSMYLKSNVVISSTNTGDGTYEHPYDIELASS